MRSLEFLAAACAFAICVSAANTYKPKSLHTYNVQAFNFETSSAILTETAHGGAEYLNKIIFIGDSRTYGLKSFAMLDGGEETDKVWTPKNGTMSIWDMQYQKIVFPDTKEELTCADAAKIKKPQIIIISLGFNGFELVEKEYFISEYTKLINEIKAASPTTKIILQAMLPVCKEYKLTTNEKINEGNKWILETAESTGCLYLKTDEAVKDHEGYLIKEFSTDGCHLTPLGLDAQIEYICTHMAGDN